MRQYKDKIEEIFSKVKTPYWDLNAFKKVCHELISKLENFRKENGLTSLYEAFESGDVDTDSWYCVKDIGSWYTKEFMKVIDHMKGFGTKGCSKRVRRVIKYIHEHYYEDISIDDLAEKLRISSVYLSQLFKKETGQTLLKYLTNYRIEVAKRLLNSGEFKIYEVAEMVGYKTGQYFSQVFHSVTGETPYQYMKRGRLL